MLTAATAAGAQDIAPQKSKDIVVKGQQSDDAQEKQVVVGSRIARKPLYSSEGVASNTGLAALGGATDMTFDALGRTVTTRSKGCRVKDAVVSAPVACTLLIALKADPATAKSVLTAALGRPGLTDEDKFVIESELYRVTDEVGDKPAKRQALTYLVDSGHMAPTALVPATRALASMAYSAGDTTEALNRYVALAKLDPDDTTARANAAALMEGAGRRDDARGMLVEAVAIAQRRGQPVPDAWLDRIKPVSATH
ncbi:tetratricopeptide repeat protein [Sphingomonas nostoxanthinifaciens]|uniref:tetratricopeptide repeat protein n=1 Tax=Sphingomonas nostoxanthinifaciens TaxID=2872652 RepID=UPI001CC209B6|nr:tetratricopeptide repeat protein [Sphingomonas nostoxanthinifaciens]UAK23480.1 tetratricopeptide repeat protein [Sphingomonas nostoxanthinifaciens]